MNAPAEASSGGRSWTTVHAAILLFGIRGYRQLPVLERTFQKRGVPDIKLVSEVPGAAKPPTRLAVGIDPWRNRWNVILHHLPGLDRWTSSSSAGNQKADHAAQCN